MKTRTVSRRSSLLDGPWSLELSSPSETERLGRTLGRVLQGGEVIALEGELGVGKTALVRGVASGLNVRPASVSSPTFVLIHQYHGRLPLIHVDLYRLRTESEAENIGLHEYFDGLAVTAIEWADRLPTFLPNDRLEVRMCHNELDAPNRPDLSSRQAVSPVASAHPASLACAATVHSFTSAFVRQIAKGCHSMIRLILVGVLLLLSLAFSAKPRTGSHPSLFLRLAGRLDSDLQADLDRLCHRPPGIRHTALPSMGTKPHRTAAENESAPRGRGGSRTIATITRKTFRTRPVYATT